MRLLLFVIARRLLLAVPIIWVIATIMFLLLQLIPGTPAAVILGPDATPEQFDRINEELGLNDPLPVKYGNYMAELLSGSLGNSWISRRPVTDLIGNRVVVTFSLAILALLVAASIGVLLGTLAATVRGRVDKVITVGSGLGLAIPSFWLGIVLVAIFALELAWLPATGYRKLWDSPTLWVAHLVLPVTALAFAQIASITRQTRSEMISVLNSDFVRTLRAAGTSRASIIWKHALRNASVPVVTVMGILFADSLSGAIIIERVFALPGMGSLTIDAAFSNDFPVVQGVVVVTALLVLAVNLIVDVAHIIIQPRVR